MIAAALSIAGSDSGGGAGIQADIKSFSALGVFATTAITALTAQNTQGVQGVYSVSADFVESQIRSVHNDINVSAVKLGMLANRDIVIRVAELIDELELSPVVLDPVMVAQSGDSLLTDDAVEAIKNLLISSAKIITPNIPEAGVLLGKSTKDLLVDPWQATQELLALGSDAVLLKGGHALDVKNEGKVYDYFLSTGEKEVYTKTRIDTSNTHGSGCALAAAIAAYLAKGLDLASAVKGAESFIDGAINYADDLNIGKGNGPVHHLHKWWNKDD